MSALRALVQGLASRLAWWWFLVRSRLSGHRGESLDRAASVLHIRRLGAEMLEVLQTVEEDLQSLGVDSTTGPLCAHCREYRDDIERILASHQGRYGLAARRLEQLLAKLHDDHRRVVNLRSDVDRMLLIRRGGHAGNWVPTRRPTGSTWTSSGFRTSASTVR